MLVSSEFCPNDRWRLRYVARSFVPRYLTGVDTRLGLQRPRPSHHDAKGGYLAHGDGLAGGVSSPRDSRNFGAQSIPATTVAGASTTLAINAQGTTTINFHARDNAGNVEAVQSLTVRVDKAPPTINITAPVNTIYALNQAVTAGYSCGDSVSGLVTCTGNVPAGGNIDTSMTGAHNFTVTATDVAGNSSTTTVSYRVSNSNPTYNVRLLYDPAKSHNIGSTIPIKIQLLNSLTGMNVSSSDLVAHAIGVVKESDFAPGPVEDAGNANPDDNFRFNNFEGEGGYIFNLKTTGLTTGTYVLVFQAGNDPFTYGVKFQVK